MHWEILEEEIGETIPKYAKDLMVGWGFETVAILKNITSESIIETE